MKRGAYFFVLDAFIAGIIIISSLTVVFSALTVPTNPTQNYVLAENYMSFLETTTVLQYQGDVIYYMRQDGDITDTSVSLLQQIAIFYAATDYDNVELLLNEIAKSAPASVGMNYTVSGSSGSDTQTWAIKESPIAEHKNVLSARRVVNVPGTITPYVVEVRLWR